VRLAPGLYRRIKAAAEANGRTINAEIAVRLQASFNFLTIDEVILSTSNSVANRLESMIELTVTKAIAGYFNQEDANA
jgi:hypothetical protein